MLAGTVYAVCFRAGKCSRPGDWDEAVHLGRVQACDRHGPNLVATHSADGVPQLRPLVGPRSWREFHEVDRQFPGDTAGSSSGS